VLVLVLCFGITGCSSSDPNELPERSIDTSPIDRVESGEAEISTNLSESELEPESPSTAEVDSLFEPSEVTPQEVDELNDWCLGLLGPALLEPIHISVAAASGDWSSFGNQLADEISAVRGQVPADALADIDSTIASLRSVTSEQETLAALDLVAALDDRCRKES